MRGAGSQMAKRFGRAIGVILLAELMALCPPDRGHAASQTRFWNLTSGTISEFRLAPTGSNAFGPNQCANDKDGTVDHDERLVILGVAPGRYDAKITYTTGRACFARNLELKEGKVFSIDDHDLKDCK
jgi:hypothetical protein